MAATHFGTASTPASTGSNGTSPATVTPPGSMADGDLVVAFAFAQDTTGTHTVSTAGGQTWNSLTQYTGGGMTSQVFWCRFNGTWSTDPAFAFSGSVTNGFSVVMLVFRPTTGTNTWAVDVAQTNANTSTGGATLTITGITRNTADAVALAAWINDNDDGGGATGGGAGWTHIANQHRNLAGNDIGGAFAHSIGSGATGDVTKTFGALAGHTWTFAFKEEAAGGGSITGTASVTQAGDTVTAAGTVALSATASPTQAGDSLAAAGTLLVTGTLSSTQAGDTLTATGGSGTTGSLDATQASDTASATGTLLIAGTATPTQAGDSLSAAGTVLLAGSLSGTQAGDAVTAAGTLRITAAASVTQAGDTLSASGADPDAAAGTQFFHFVRTSDRYLIRFKTD